ncbi:lipoprotein LpqH [[Mycobacterium] burgundiense]|uniref:Lipoprotein LpqH n=1 Tax=[Mycobacterium] burgundiense TaxID=3064286 RepID=A0ABM9L939_9MYCO|nr:lipoprotein LpqH [Mycolicibacterium sp. MU0053]CAJ1494898.1 lipoprotein LpqH [Mycolicibacterium sp. MU0053]
MKSSVLAGGCTVALVLLAGCSSQDADTPDDTASTTATSATVEDAPAESGNAPAGAAADHIKFGSSDVGEISSVTCQSEGGVTTITVEADQDATVVLTDEETPAVKSVSIGEAGSDGPSLVFLQGVSPTPEAKRDGNRVTVTGSGMGTDSAETSDPGTPVEMPFEVAVSCP